MIKSDEKVFNRAILLTKSLTTVFSYSIFQDSERIFCDFFELLKNYFSGKNTFLARISDILINLSGICEFKELYDFNVYNTENGENQCIKLPPTGTILNYRKLVSAAFKVPLNVTCLSVDDSIFDHVLNNKTINLHSNVRILLLIRNCDIYELDPTKLIANNLLIIKILYKSASIEKKNNEKVWFLLEKLAKFSDSKEKLLSLDLPLSEIIFPEPFLFFHCLESIKTLSNDKS